MVPLEAIPEAYLMGDTEDRLLGILDLSMWMLSPIRTRRAVQTRNWLKLDTRRWKLPTHCLTILRREKQSFFWAVFLHISFTTVVFLTRRASLVGQGKPS